MRLHLNTPHYKRLQEQHRSGDICAFSLIKPIQTWIGTGSERSTGLILETWKESSSSLPIEKSRSWESEVDPNKGNRLILRSQQDSLPENVCSIRCVGRMKMTCTIYIEFSMRFFSFLLKDPFKVSVFSGQSIRFRPGLLDCEHRRLRRVLFFYLYI